MNAGEAKPRAVGGVGAMIDCARSLFGRPAIVLAPLVLAAAGPAASQGLIPVPYAGDDLYPRPDVNVWLRLIRNDKLDLILPGAMREHGIDMWIHATRAGDPDPLAYEFGITDGYLVFTDVGDRVERAVFGGVFGGSGAIEDIDVEASPELSQAITGYEYGHVDFAVYDEIRDYVAGHDPGTIGVNFSDWLAVADGISHTRYQKLERILGPELSSRIVSAEYLITDFRSRRLSLEVAVQAMLLEAARQDAMTRLANIEPGPNDDRRTGRRLPHLLFGRIGTDSRALGHGLDQPSGIRVPARGPLCLEQRRRPFPGFRILLLRRGHEGACVHSPRRGDRGPGEPAEGLGLRQEGAGHHPAKRPGGNDGGRGA